MTGRRVEKTLEGSAMCPEGLCSREVSLGLVDSKLVMPRTSAGPQGRSWVPDYSLVAVKIALVCSVSMYVSR